ncbi:hypothetical protein DF186_18985, partial [Enterococcus hirae]
AGIGRRAAGEPVMMEAKVMKIQISYSPISFLRFQYELTRTQAKMAPKTLQQEVKSNPSL